jgi:hypothetical protein
MMITYGLEREFFFVDAKDNFTLAPDELPTDECKWLLEARGEPSPSIYKAVLSLQLEEGRIKKVASDLGIKVMPVNFLKIPKESIRLFLRGNNAKPLGSAFNYLGHDHHLVGRGTYTAGTHISVCNHVQQYSYTYELELTSGGVDKKSKINVVNKKHENGTLNRNFNWMKLFINLDKAFKKDIKDARRNPGFFEFKEDGRVEYRSLPATVDMHNLADIVEVTNL